MNSGHQLLRASAGTGKTYQLVEAYVREVKAGIRPSEIVAITFTRKAAAELRGRIRARLKAEGFDKSILAELSQAPISNFHGLALQLLRSFGLTGGLQEGIAVLGEEGDADVVFLQACEDAWFAGDAATAAALEQVSPYFATDTSLPDALLWAVDKAREDDRVIDAADLLGAYDPEGLRQRLHQQILELVEWLPSVHDQVTKRGQECIRGFLESPHPAVDAPFDEWVAAWERAGDHLDKRSFRKLLDEEVYRLVKPRKTTPSAVSEVLAEALCARLAPSLAVLFDVAWAAYVEAKQLRRACDFGDLVRNLVDLLDGRRELHAALRQRIGSVLVDEAQDTNRLQRRMVRLLAGLEGPAADEGEPARLFVVGDRKQCIYTFRGADPESFTAFTEDVLALGGTDETLEVSWRSVPELVSGINSLGGALFGDDYEKLEPNPDPGEGRGPLGRAAMTWLELPEEGLTGGAATRREAEALAAWVAEQQRAGVPPGDFALLMSAMTRAPLFLAALSDVGIPAVLGGGGGLYEQPEVGDVIAALGWLTDATDRLAAAEALRSPLVGLSDAGLMALVRRSKDGGDPLLALRDARLDGFVCSTAGDAAIVARVGERLPELIRAAAVTSAAETLHLIDRAFDLRATYVALEAGEQRLANLDRLWELARVFDASGRGGVARFAREQLDNLRRGHKEPLTPVPAAARRAVTISTIHQAKGLQYPVVLLADLRNKGSSDRGALRYEHQAGLVFRPSSRGQSVASARWKAATVQLEAERIAERKRLLYVAMTRAQREVIFVGTAAQESRKAGFATHLDGWRPQAEEAGVLLRQAAPVRAEAPVARAAVQPTADDRATAASWIESATSLPAPAGARFALPVTSLETFLSCSRRGFLVHDLQIEEPGFPDPRTRWPAVDDREPALDPMTRGRLAHEVLAALERCDSVEQSEAFVDAELSLAGYDPRDERLGEVRRDVIAFIGSDLGRRLLELGADNRRHELPFQLAIDAGPHVAVLHGQIDLLYWDDEQPIVLDYKLARSGSDGLSRYHLQLQAYALAVEGLCGVDGDIRTGLAFLRDRAAPQMHAVTATARRQLEQAIGGVVSVLAECRGRDLPWPGQPKEVCDALRCGFAQRCHGSSSPDSPAGPQAAVSAV